MSISADNAAPPPTSTGGSISMTAIEVNVKPPTDSDSGVPSAKPRVQFSDKVQRFPESAPTSPHATSPKVTQPPEVLETKSAAPAPPTSTDLATTHPVTSVPEKPENDETPSLSLDIQVGAAPPSFDAAIEVLHDKPLTGPGSNVVIEVNSPLPEAAANIIPALTSPVTPPPQTTSSEPAQENNLPSRPERSGLITHAILNVEMVREPKEPPKNQDEWDADTARIFFAINLFDKNDEAAKPSEKSAAAPEKDVLKTDNTMTEPSVTTSDTSGAEQRLNSVTQPKAESGSLANEASAASDQTNAENVVKPPDSTKPSEAEKTDNAVNEQKQDTSAVVAQSSETSASVEAKTENKTLGQASDNSVNAATDSKAEVSATSVAIPVNIDQAAAAEPATEAEKPPAPAPATETSSATTVPAPNAEPVAIPVNIDLAQGPEPTSDSTSVPKSEESLQKVDLTPLLASTPSNDQATLNALANARPSTDTKTTTEATHADVAVNIDVGEQKTAPGSDTPAAIDNVSATPAAFNTLPETTAFVDVKIERVQAESHASDANDNQGSPVEPQQQTSANTEGTAEGLTKPADNASAEVTHSNEKVEVVAAPIRVEGNQVAPPAAETTTGESAKSTDITSAEQKTAETVEETVQIPVRFEGENAPVVDVQISVGDWKIASGEETIDIPISLEGESEAPIEETIEIPVRFEGEGAPVVDVSISIGDWKIASNEEIIEIPISLEDKAEPVEEIIEIPVRFEGENAPVLDVQISVGDWKIASAEETIDIPIRLEDESAAPVEETVQIPVRFEGENAPVVDVQISVGDWKIASGEEIIEVPISIEGESEAKPLNAEDKPTGDAQVQAETSTDGSAKSDAGVKSTAPVEEIIEIPVRFEGENAPVSDIQISTGDWNIASGEETIEIPISIEDESAALVEDMIEIPVHFEGENAPVVDVPISVGDWKIASEEETIDIPIRVEGETEPEPEAPTEKDQIVDIPIEVEGEPEPKPSTDAAPVLEQVVNIAIGEDADQIVDIPIEVEQDSEPKAAPEGPAPVLEQVVNIPLAVEEAEKSINIPIEVEPDTTPNAPAEGPTPVLEQVVNVPISSGEEDKIVDIPIEVEGDAEPKPASDATVAQPADKSIDIPIQVEGEAETKPSDEVPGAVVENVVKVAIGVDDTAASEPSGQNAESKDESKVEENVVQIPVITLNGEVHPESVAPAVSEVKPEDTKLTETTPVSTESSGQTNAPEATTTTETQPATVDQTPSSDPQESPVPKEVAELANKIADNATTEAVKAVDGTSAPNSTDEITVQTTFAKPLFEENAQTKPEVPPVEPAKEDEIKFQTTFAKPMDSNPSSPVPASSPKAGTDGEVSFQTGFAKPLTETPTNETPKQTVTDDSGVSWTEVPASGANNAAVNEAQQPPKSPVKDSAESKIQTGFAKPLLAEPEKTESAAPKDTSTTQKDVETSNNSINQKGFAKPLLQDTPATSSPVKSVPPPLVDDDDDFWTEVPPNAVVHDIPIKVVSTPSAPAPTSTTQNVNEPVQNQPKQNEQTVSAVDSKQVEQPKSPSAGQQPKPASDSDEIVFYEVPKGHDLAIEPETKPPASPAQKTNDGVDLNIDQYEAQLKKNTKEALALVDKLVDEATAHGQQQAAYKSRPDQYSPPRDRDRRPRTSSQSPSPSGRSVPNSPFSENKLVEAQSYRVNPELLGDATAVALLPDFRLVLADLEKGLTVFNLYTKEQKRFECGPRFRNPLCLYHLPRPKELLVLCEYSENSDGNFGLYICRFTYDLEYVNRVEAPKFLHDKEISTYRMAFCLRTGCLYLAASAYNTGYLYEFSPEGFWTEVYTGRNKHFTDIAIFAVIGPVTEIMLVDSIKDYVVVVSIYNSETADQRLLAASEKPTSLCIDECGHVIIFDRYSNKVGIHSRLTNLRYHDIALVEHSKCRLAAYAGLLAVLAPSKKELRIYKY